MITHTLGFPTIGVNRELKRAVELYWKNEISELQLMIAAREIRNNNWLLQIDQGVSIIPVGDFSLYDQMLDLVCALGAVPPRFGYSGGPVDLATYFHMARGSVGAGGVAPMEMTKWFDTNYHYIVPEFHKEQRFGAHHHALLEHLDEAESLGVERKAVLPGPVTFMALGKVVGNSIDKWAQFESLLEGYCALVDACSGNCEWIQIDEPFLVNELNCDMKQRYRTAFEEIARASGYAKIMLATYFGGIAHNMDIIRELPFDCLHMDCMRAPNDVGTVLSALPDRVDVSLGIIDGRNIWRADIDAAIEMVERAVALRGAGRIMIAPSCSLKHVPVDSADETDIEPEIHSWLSFAVQKCAELSLVADTVSGSRDRSEQLAEHRSVTRDRATSSKGFDGAVIERSSMGIHGMLARTSAYPERRIIQQHALNLPPYPTTTIGSFPQTSELRRTRRQWRKGEIDTNIYEAVMKQYIADCIRTQEEIGLDVLVHGEPERNDMVEYFAEHFEGFCFTRNGWVQSYGTRCVKPPIIYGDVSRPEPMTVSWITYAQSLTRKPIKGMLTGPVTLLCWSFVRDDQSREETCRQIAYALRDEVADLESAGISIIQIDEPALREGAPVRMSERDHYYYWASECFRLATSGVSDSTQIHTHMCYSEFNEIVKEIASLDADVISIEASRSNMELLDAFRDFEYPNEIGPGVYDIHSPRIPGIEEMTNLLIAAARYIPPERLWINPDCGLKTRRWEDVKAALKNMVEAARNACVI